MDVSLKLPKKFAKNIWASDCQPVDNDTHDFHMILKALDQNVAVKDIQHLFVTWRNLRNNDQESIVDELEVRELFFALLRKGYALDYIEGLFENVDCIPYFTRTVAHYGEEEFTIAVSPLMIATAHHPDDGVLSYLILRSGFSTFFFDHQFTVFEKRDFMQGTHVWNELNNHRKNLLNMHWCIEEAQQKFTHELFGCLNPIFSLLNKEACHLRDEYKKAGILRKDKLPGATRFLFDYLSVLFDHVISNKPIAWVENTSETFLISLLNLLDSYIKCSGLPDDLKTELLALWGAPLFPVYGMTDAEIEQIMSEPLRQWIQTKKNQNFSDKLACVHAPKVYRDHSTQLSIRDSLLLKAVSCPLPEDNDENDEITLTRRTINP